MFLKQSLICRPFSIYFLINISVWFLSISLASGLLRLPHSHSRVELLMWVWGFINSAANESFSVLFSMPPCLASKTFWRISLNINLRPLGFLLGLLGIPLKEMEMKNEQAISHLTNTYSIGHAAQKSLSTMCMKLMCIRDASILS